MEKKKRIDNVKCFFFYFLSLSFPLIHSSPFQLKISGRFSSVSFPLSFFPQTENTRSIFPFYFRVSVPPSLAFSLPPSPFQVSIQDTPTVLRGITTLSSSLIFFQPPSLYLFPFLSFFLYLSRRPGGKIRLMMTFLKFGLQKGECGWMNKGQVV